jgi:cyclophilin family peptidyl-prolyl cis-trans isomerase
MNRILPVMMVAALLVVGGIWLSRSQSQPQQPPPPVTEAERADDVASAPADLEAEAEAADAVDLEALPLPEGFSLVPHLSDEPRQVFEQAEFVLEDNTDYGAIIVTNRGVMRVDLFQDAVPNTVNNFVFLALNRYYDGIVFHRVLEDFMAQTGDPTGTGTGGPGYSFADEFVEGLVHDAAGILSMANSGPNTNGSQFFITFVPTPWLDGRHSVFGRVAEGLEVLDAITRIDPSQPSAIVSTDETLADLAAQGITLAGDPEANITAYITEKLGAEPVIGQTFTIDGMTAVAGRIGATPAYGFYPQPDVMENVFIIARRRE